MSYEDAVSERNYADKKKNRTILVGGVLLTAEAAVVVADLLFGSKVFAGAIAAKHIAEAVAFFGTAAWTVSQALHHNTSARIGQQSADFRHRRDMGDRMLKPRFDNGF